MISGVQDLFKIDENYTVDKAIVNINRPAVYSIRAKDHNRQLLRLTIVSAKSNIHSPRRGYLSPGSCIILEIDVALLFISVTNSCRFWASFVEMHARFQQTCTFKEFMYALRAYYHHELFQPVLR